MSRTTNGHAASARHPLLQKLHEQGTKALGRPELEQALVLIREQREGETDLLAPLEDKVNRALQRQYRKYADDPDQQVLGVASPASSGLPQVLRTVSPELHSTDVNMLTDQVSIIDSRYAQTFIKTASELIGQTGGKLPEMGKCTVRVGNQQCIRLVVKWETKRHVGTYELHTLRRIMRQAYDHEITGYAASGRGWQEVGTYQGIDGRTTTGARGIYFGPDTNYYGAANGLFIYRKFRRASEATLLQSDYPFTFLEQSTTGRMTSPTIKLELRDSGKKRNEIYLAQDEFLYAVVQISFLLAKGKILSQEALMTAIFRELNRLGTRQVKRGMLYGMTKVLETIDRVLLLPLRRPDLARQLQFNPESILLTGVPGVGKTFLEEYLMSTDHNALFVAVDTTRLAQELGDAEQNGILSRLSRIMRLTGLPIIMILDDIDAILGEKEAVAQFLNMMQGIRQQGFFVLASTNHPYEIDLRLLEPGRLSKTVHVELPNRDERQGVLRNYLRHQPFVDDDTREAIINEMATRTENWTQRLLWELTEEAGRLRGIAVEHGEPQQCQLGDYEQAVQLVEQGVNLDELVKWNQRIAEFVSQVSAPMGLPTAPAKPR